MIEANRPLYPKHLCQGPFYEVWYVKCNAPTDDGALWLRFAVIKFTDAAWRGDVWAVFFPAKGLGAPLSVHKSLVGDFLCERPANEALLDWPGVYLSEQVSRGEIREGATGVAWDLKLSPLQTFNFHYAPAYLRAILSAHAGTPQTNIGVSGTVTVNAETTTLTSAPGSQGHYAGKAYPHSWAWAHCNAFDNATEPTVFEIIVVKPKPFLPVLKSCYIRYKGKDCVINGVPSIFSHSQHTQERWLFTARQSGLEFKIDIERAGAGVAKIIYEDVDHRPLTCHNVKQAGSTLTVLRHGVVESQFVSMGTTAFESVKRE